MTSPGARKTCPTSWHPYLPPGAVETPGVGHRMTGYHYSTFTTELLTLNEPRAERAHTINNCYLKPTKRIVESPGPGTV